MTCATGIDGGIVPDAASAIAIYCQSQDGRPVDFRCETSAYWVHTYTNFLVGKGVNLTPLSRVQMQIFFSRVRLCHFGIRIWPFEHSKHEQMENIKDELSFLIAYGNFWEGSKGSKENSSLDFWVVRLSKVESFFRSWKRAKW